MTRFMHFNRGIGGAQPHCNVFIQETLDQQVANLFLTRRQGGEVALNLHVFRDPLKLAVIKLDCIGYGI